MIDSIFVSVIEEKENADLIPFRRKVNIERTENRNSRIAYLQSVIMINVIKVDENGVCNLYVRRHQYFTAEQLQPHRLIWHVSKHSNAARMWIEGQRGSASARRYYFIHILISSFGAAVCIGCALLTFISVFLSRKRDILEGETHICRSAVGCRVRRLSFSYLHETRGSLSTNTHTHTAGSVAGWAVALWIFINLYFESHLIGIVYGVNSRLVGLCQLSLFTADVFFSIILFVLFMACAIPR